MEKMSKQPPGANPASGAHGGGVRGDRVNRGSRTFVGRFGRMFRTLPAAEFDEHKLKELAQAMSAPPEMKDGKPAAAVETDERIQDGEENSRISAGYTYLGQFIDHDITFDPASSLQKRNDPDGLTDFRTPALDLDCLYGRGPEDQPYMYDHAGRKFILGEPLHEKIGGPIKTHDLPRLGVRHRAVIGDKRNDENVIVSQLQGVFLQFHNRLADEHHDLSFSEIQRLVRWHYQYVVVHDYLPKIVGDATMNKIWPDRHIGNVCGHGPHLCYYHFRDAAYMPIEFAAAAYRYGHSMVRPIYRLNTEHHSNGPADDPSIAGRFFIFAGVQERGLNGFGRFPRDWAIDWSLFFDINGSGTRTLQSGEGKFRLQPAYKIDTSIVNPLAYLPEFSLPPKPVGTALTVAAKPTVPHSTLQSTEQNSKNPSNLAIRNLLRGNSMGLPSGQTVAIAMGEEPIKSDKLMVGKAQLNDDGSVDAKNIGTVAGGYFNNNSPLWFYVLAESNAQWREKTAGMNPEDANKTEVTLGTVGGRIVAETLIGLLLADSHSFLNQAPTWRPPTANKTTGEYTMGDFIKYALNIK